MSNVTLGLILPLQCHIRNRLYCIGSPSVQESQLQLFDMYHVAPILDVWRAGDMYITAHILFYSPSVKAALDLDWNPRTILVTEHNRHASPEGGSRISHIKNKVTLPQCYYYVVC